MIVAAQPFLTKRQWQTYRAIRTLLDKHGIPPTLHDIARVLGVKHATCVYRHVNALLRAGLIVKGTGQRSIMLPDGEAEFGVLAMRIICRKTDGCRNEDIADQLGVPKKIVERAISLHQAWREAVG